MTDKLFTEDEQKRYEAKARERGFKSLRDYVLWLIERDNKKHLTEDEIDDGIRRIIEEYDAQT